MKAFSLALLAICSGLLSFAQQKQGKITYQRVNKMVARFVVNGVENEMPQTRKDNFDLFFNETQTMWKAGENPDEDLQNNAGDDGNGMHIRMMVAGGNDQLFTNLETGKKTEKREFMDKTFIVDDSVKNMKWKMTGETKVILGHPCMRAESQTIQTKMTMNMDNGQMTRKEISDTSVVVAWFTSDIPVSTGPAEFQGQLPGAILELSVGGDKQHYEAVAISDKADLAVIKEPTGKKHYTTAGFRAEMKKMMEEMQQNMGGNRQFRMGN